MLRVLRHVPELLAGSMARLHALDPDRVRGELAQVREAPVNSGSGRVRCVLAIAAR